MTPEISGPDGHHSGIEGFIFDDAFLTEGRGLGDPSGCRFCGSLAAGRGSSPLGAGVEVTKVTPPPPETARMSMYREAYDISIIRPEPYNDLSFTEKTAKTVASRKWGNGKRR